MLGIVKRDFVRRDLGRSQPRENGGRLCLLHQDIVAALLAAPGEFVLSLTAPEHLEIALLRYPHVMWLDRRVEYFDHGAWREANLS